ncbi:MAG: DUF1566 domain-containing protein [Bacteroidales bacterium]|nr:DUF1566 domain-containing protein [Bacteroidales bacterium]
MKKTMTYVVAAAAVAMALVSCSKDKLIEKGTRNEQTSGVRTLTVSFAQGTKTNISNDMQTPVWAEGDQISLNGTPYVVPAEAKGKSTCKITTDIQGDIVAVYPASAWTAEEPHYKVESTQDGSFSNANICIDTVKAGDTKIEFKNKTALFHVVVPTNTEKKTTLTVTSLKTIGIIGQRWESAAGINTEGANDAAKAVITVEIPANTSEQNFYISVLPGVKLTDLNFDITRDGETGKGEQGGFSANYLKKEKNISDPYSCAVVENTIYTVDPSFFHEYLVVDGTKWATMNVGATETNPNGLYFAWGETTGHEANDAKTGFKEGYSFSWSNAPFNNKQSSYDGNYFDDVRFTVCPDGVLALAYDAAFVNWGGAWRMPDRGEFNSFFSGGSPSGGNFTYKGVTFPAAGYGDGAELKKAGEGGYYWSSSLDEDSSAFNLNFYNNYVDTDTPTRNTGRSVRPLSE